MIVTVTRDAILTAARSLIGTPFQHQGRSRFGLDCAGMVVVSLSMCGYACADARDYNRYSAGKAMPDTLEKFADRIAFWDARKADLITFWRSKPGLEEHIAWYAPPNHIIQSWIKGGAKEVTFDGRWRERVVGAWRVRGVE